MKIESFKIKKLLPPQDDLLKKIYERNLKFKEKDIIAISSKVVSIHEGRCVAIGSVNKDDLIKKESQLYLDRKHTVGGSALHTITHNILIRNAGIDESNANNHYVLWPKDSFASAKSLQRALRKKYKIKKLAVIITDSISSPLRRGATGFALSWYGIGPLYDYRGTKDLFGRELQVSVANLVDALAASAVLVMGEGNEQTPIAIIRDVPDTIWHPRQTKKEWSSFVISFKEDLFAPFLKAVPWKKGGQSRH